MKSSGLSAWAVSDSIGVGDGEELVVSGILGFGSGSSVHPARTTGTARVSASARRTCKLRGYMRRPSREQRQHAETTHPAVRGTTPTAKPVENRGWVAADSADDAGCDVICRHPHRHPDARRSNP